MAVQQQYYSLPLSLEQVMQKKDHAKSTLRQSVAQYLHLIMTTAFGELLTDEQFGCSIWEHDFDVVTGKHKIRELMKQSLLQSIVQYEKRLGDVRIELVVSQEESADSASAYRVKKKMGVTVTGTLLSTNEPFKYADEFFTAPLSYQLI